VTPAFTSDLDFFFSFSADKWKSQAGSSKPFGGWQADKPGTTFHPR